MQFTQLLPEPGSLDLAELRSALSFPTHTERPYLLANFVSTADGRAALQGRSAPLSSPGDHAMFHALRERVDALLAGTQTLRTERYGRPIRDPEARERRAQRGLAPEPLACVITRSGELPTDIPLFTEPDVRVIVFTSVWIDRLPEHIEIVQLDPGEMTLLTVMRRLRVEHDVSSLLCEGGPTLFGSLLDEGLVDELFLTISPTLAGGGMEPTISRGMGLAEPATMSLRWALEREQSLFLRYSVFTNSE